MPPFIYLLRNEYQNERNKQETDDKWDFEIPSCLWFVRPSLLHICPAPEKQTVQLLTVIYTLIPTRWEHSLFYCIVNQLLLNNATDRQNEIEHRRIGGNL